jgi:hypothetical protein
MHKETQKEPNCQSFEIYEYDNSLKEFGDKAIGFAYGRDTAEACKNFTKESGWSNEGGDKFLWAKPPICR